MSTKLMNIKYMPDQLIETQNTIIRIVSHIKSTKDISSITDRLPFPIPVYY